MNAACRSTDKPEVRRVSRTPSRCSSRHSAGKSECMRGSPPEKTTHLTLSARKPSTWGFRSSSLISRTCRIFQISHITHRQLQRLWGRSTRIGSSTMRCAITIHRPDFAQKSEAHDRQSIVRPAGARASDRSRQPTPQAEGNTQRQAPRMTAARRRRHPSSAPEGNGVQKSSSTIVQIDNSP